MRWPGRGEGGGGEGHTMLTGPKLGTAQAMILFPLVKLIFLIILDMNIIICHAEHTHPTLLVPGLKQELCCGD